MFRSMQKNWVIWIRAVAGAAAGLAILVSALAMSQEIDHRVLPTQPAVASAADVGLADGSHADPAADADCHVGHSSMLAIMPSNDMALTCLDSAPELPRATRYLPSVAGYLPFHPPRILSQV